MTRPERGTMTRRSPIGDLLRSRVEITPAGRLALTVEAAFWAIVTRAGFPWQLRRLEAETGVTAADVFTTLGAGQWEITERGRAHLAKLAAADDARNARRGRGRPSLAPAADRPADGQCGAARRYSGGRP